MNLKEWKLAKWGFVISTILYSTVLQAQQDTASQHAFSLQQALEYARQHNVQVKNALIDISLQHQVNREVTGRAYPQIFGNVSTTYNPAVATQVIPNFISPPTRCLLMKA